MFNVIQLAAKTDAMIAQQDTLFHHPTLANQQAAISLTVINVIVVINCFVILVRLDILSTLIYQAAFLSVLTLSVLIVSFLKHVVVVLLVIRLLTVVVY